MPAPPDWASEGAIVALAGDDLEKSLDRVDDLHARGLRSLCYVNPMFRDVPDDPTAWTVDDQFLLGDEILVAPIENKCWTSPWCPYDKELYLPPGPWVHLWTGDVYGDFDGEWVTVGAPIGEPAAFYRADGDVGPELVDRLADEGIAAALP